MKRKASRLSLLLALVPALLIPAPASAAPDTPSFAVFPAGYQVYAAAIDQQADGKFVVAGYATQLKGSATDPDPTWFALARFNADGTPDTTFGTAGTGAVITEVGLGRSATVVSDPRIPASAARDLRILADGTIVLGGYAYWYRDVDYPATSKKDTARVFALVGYTPDGTPDPQFGATYVGAARQPGVVLTALQRNDQITAMAASGDKIVVAGTAKPVDLGKVFAWAGYESNGALDTSFGDRGTLTTRFGGASQNNTPLDVFVGANGDIVTVGTDSEPSLTTNTARFAVAKFGREGDVQQELKTLLSFDSEYDAAYAGELLANGRILIAGNTFDRDTGNLGAIIAKLSPDLTRDTAFGKGGHVLNFNPSWRQSAALSIEVQPDDGLLTSGAAATSVTGPVKWQLSRYWADGTLDPAFGSLGNDVEDVGVPVPDGVRNDGFDGAVDVKTLPDGRSVATGTVQTTAGGDKTFGLAFFETTSAAYDGPTDALAGDWAVSAKVTSSALCASGKATFVGYAAGAEVSRATADVVAGLGTATLTAPVGLDRVVVSYAPTDSACLGSSQPRQVTSRAPEPAPVKKTQKPVQPLNLPKRLWRTGRTMLLELPVRTNAGQKASVRVQTISVKPRAAGEQRRTDVRVLRRDGRLYVWLSGQRTTKVKVSIKAPATADYTRYERTKTYRTSAVR